MSDSDAAEARLLDVAKRVLPSWYRLRVIRDELAVGGVVVYTLETIDSKDHARWFAFPGASLRANVTDDELIAALNKAVNDA